MASFLVISLSLIFLFNLLSLIYFYMEYEYRIRALLLFHGLASVSLIFVVTNILDIFYYPTLQPNSISEFNLFLILFSGIIIPIFLAMMFNYAVFGGKTEVIVNVTIGMGLFLAGISVSSFINEDAYLINHGIEDQEWRFDFHPLFLLMLVIYVILTVGGISNGVRNVSYHKFISSGKHPVIFFSTGLIAIIIALLLDETISTPLGIGIFVFGLFSFILAIIFLFLNILEYPYTTVYLRNSTSTLFDNGFATWVLYTNKDLGPDIEIQAESLKSQDDIKPEEIVKFGTQSFLTSYNEGKFIQNVSISPFAAREDYFALSVSFSCYDPALKDDRFDNQLQCVLVIIVPTEIFTNFDRSINEIYSINSIINEMGLAQMEISEIRDHEFLEDFSKTCLNALM